MLLIKPCCIYATFPAGKLAEAGEGLVTINLIGSMLGLHTKVHYYRLAENYFINKVVAGKQTKNS